METYRRYISSNTAGQRTDLADKLKDIAGKLEEIASSIDQARRKSETKVRVLPTWQEPEMVIYHFVCYRCGCTEPTWAGAFDVCGYCGGEGRPRVWVNPAVRQKR